MFFAPVSFAWQVHGLLHTHSFYSHLRKSILFIANGPVSNCGCENVCTCSGITRGSITSVISVQKSTVCATLIERFALGMSCLASKIHGNGMSRTAVALSAFCLWIPREWDFQEIKIWIEQRRICRIHTLQSTSCTNPLHFQFNVSVFTKERYVYSGDSEHNSVWFLQPI